MPVAESQGAPSLVRPFRGEQYRATDTLSRLIAPPYDVIGREKRKQLAARSEHNIVHLLLPEGGEGRYDRAARSLEAWRNAGILERARNPGIAVIRQSFRHSDGITRHRTGLIGAVAVEPFAAGRVKPHEKTHAKPKADRLALLRTTRTVFDALFMLARDESGDLQSWLADVTTSRPSARADLDGVSVELWMTAGEPGEPIAAAANQEALYIADGHHRYETAIAFQRASPQADRTLSLIVPLGDPGLVVLPTHRVVHGHPIRHEALLDHLRERFQVREVPAEDDFVRLLEGTKSQGTLCALVLSGRVYLLLRKGGASLGERLTGGGSCSAQLRVARPSLGSSSPPPAWRRC
jgi:uncharacterized protein (DUF1015 family)